MRPGVPVSCGQWHISHALQLSERHPSSAGGTRRRRTLKVVVDDSPSSGKQSCIFEVPSVFRRSDDLLRTEVIDPAAASEAEIVEAALNCPFEAISVTDAEQGETLAP